MNLSTQYMGIHLKNPVIAGASQLTSDLGTIRQIEDAGAGAVVTASLFEEQIQFEQLRMDEAHELYDYRNAEMISVLPELNHAGPEEHLYWIRKTKESLSIPVIASLNAVNKDTWIEYARLLQETGADALELNFYASPQHYHTDAHTIEQEQIEILKQVLESVTIPVSVKLSPFYTNPLHFISELDETGIRGFVLFNRLFQPDIDTDSQEPVFPFHLSERSDNRLSLRYAGLLSGNIRADICSSTGIFEGEDAVKMILAGAGCVQTVSTLYRNGIGHIRNMLDDLQNWMERNGYASLEEFRGKMNRYHIKDPRVYTRAQYVRQLMKPKEIPEDHPVP